jgi:hypothetical protein
VQPELINAGGLSPRRESFAIAKWMICIRAVLSTRMPAEVMVAVAA